MLHIDVPRTAWSMFRWFAAGMLVTLMWPETAWSAQELKISFGSAQKREQPSNLWIVQRRDCRQEIGIDPRPCLKILHLDADGHLEEKTSDALWKHVHGRPILIQVQGIEVSRDLALDGMIKTRRWLAQSDALPPDAVIITFDWPSQSRFLFVIPRVNEECRRAVVAGYHLAHFIQAFPTGSRICLLGHSHGGRAVAASLHLLGGGELNSRLGGEPVRLTQRSDLRVRGVVLAAGIDHQWLNPGNKLGQALAGCEAFCSLNNRRDPLLLFYPLMSNGGHGWALGRVGLLPDDRDRLGPLAKKFVERDYHHLVGYNHTLYAIMAHPEIARWIAPFTWATPDLFGTEGVTLQPE